jgi:hypothetical protein
MATVGRPNEPVVHNTSSARTRARLVGVPSQSAVLVERVRSALVRALGERRGYYLVEIDAVGRVGEVLVSITGSHGRLPLLFRPEDLEPAYVCAVVMETLDRFGL